MKIFNIDFSFQKTLTKEYLILLILFVALLVLVLFNSLFIQDLIEHYENYSMMKEKLKTTETRIKLVDSYKVLPKEEMRMNNKILDKLLPSGDTNLSMYYILDSLSIKTGLELSDYQLSISDQNQKVSSVSVKGQGTYEDVLDFLNKYPMITGRLLTLDSIEISRIDETKEELEIQMVLNYYISDEPSISKINKTISQEDIQFMRKIAEKTLNKSY